MTVRNTNANMARAPHPNSRIKALGKSVDGRPRKATDGPDREVATYPCPYCRDRLLAGHQVDFGTVRMNPGDCGVITKYHRECKARQELKWVKAK